MRKLLSPAVYCTDCGGRVSTDMTDGRRRWYCEGSQVGFPAVVALTLRNLVESHYTPGEEPGRRTSRFKSVVQVTWPSMTSKGDAPPYCPRCAATLKSDNPWEAGYVCPLCSLRVPALTVGMVTRWAIHPLPDR